MNHRNLEKHQQRCDKYLERTKGEYALDFKSGIYKPESAYTDAKCQCCKPGTERKSPFFVNAATDWPPLFIGWVIGALTLLVVGYYTYVTSGIYKTSQATAIGTIQAAWATRDAAEAARSAANTAKETMVSSRRAWVGLKDAPIISLGTEKVEYSIVLKNFGPSPALRIDAIARPMGIMQVTDNTFGELCANASVFAKLGRNPSLPNGGYTIFPEQPETNDQFTYWTGPPPLDQPFAFVGCIAYVDEFHDGQAKTPIRHTRFCFATDATIKTLLKPENHILAGRSFTKDCPLGHLAD